MALLDKVKITALSELNPDEKLQAARLVMLSLPGYYNVDGVDELEIAQAVSGLIAKNGSETSNGFVAQRNDSVVSVLSYIPGKSLPMAQLIGVQGMCRALTKMSSESFRSHLNNLGVNFGKVPDSSIYLSRFAVDEKLQGSGLADVMFNHFLESKISTGLDKKEYSLHVHKENARAIAFYKKQGFTENETVESYLTMLKIV